VRRLANYFLRGLLIAAPIAVTGYLCWVAIRWVDSLFGTRIPGLGIAILLVGLTLLGAVASNYLTRSFIGLTDRLLERLPFVRLVYSSIKDLLSAFVGEQRRFNRPVRVELGPGEATFVVLGFMTSDALDHLGLSGYVAVYLPFSYSVAGHLIVVPADRVTPLAVDATDAMAFLLSGGVTRSAGPSGRR